ncbi:MULTISPECIES: glycosyl hydrolase 53 family protein [unclassified Breznakia]|uniref:glycosyl hydrolase 53 family protein n=1 Tax=unclassified Breznakia TaxID=2623764 RepID=UPI002473F650|nr:MULTISPECIES: glycosyl hydrolase 53 family protein [unclassified Breznakia]MDH6366950.1 arabinogalactan endo-1,4-beta-galactosidase [Breznakia sp. PH1-1]MDH6404128.1 arabinogalactan endo-1,4-beta-galactosidase [Breznakia sp. PF1-11]MDH6411837.1 arabinogalactan endo-1,4-beta-galactosidase [Breznakia sp. PFB1-11]MDH6414116.1 arabinogalactan endo-1,4-beta-galactosidase [Breznakia sp. PFB1-14]MDH6416527.1 arabinogalactan endo-1,4-beta-galactosidase [Breznakia sp. PFB1-4]
MNKIIKNGTIFLMGVFIVLTCLANYKHPTMMKDEDANEEISVQKVDNLSSDFILGADASSVISVEDSGGKYYNFDGVEQDVFEIMADAGVNYIRVKVWNDPYDENGNGYGGGNSDLAKAIEIGERATANGMKLLVDFHYSDFWADPGRQNAPKAWEGLSADQKAVEIYNYTKESLEAFQTAGVDVGMVQVGNETTGQGICGETKLENKVKLFHAGSKAIRDVNSDIKVVVHFTNPEKGNPYNYTKELYDAGVNFDVVATSYYPVWHGTLGQLSTQLNRIADDFDKEVMVAETAYPYTLADGDDQANLIKNTNQLKGYEASVDGQADMFRDVVNTVNNDVKNNKGIGVFYWENTWIPVNEGKGKRADNLALWETYGSGWATKAATSYDKSPTGSGIATTSNYGGTEVDNQAMFDFAGHALPSLNVYKYVFTGYNEEPEVDVINLLQNPGFEDEDMTMYDISQSYVSRKTDDPLTGDYSVHFYNEEPIEFEISQEVSLPAGKHKFTLHIQGGANTDTSDIYSFIEIDGEKNHKQRIELDGWCNWQEPTITFDLESEATVKVGLYVKAEAFSWGTSDDWQLVTKEKLSIVNKDILQELIDKAIALEQADLYTSSTWLNYVTALDHAKFVLNDVQATQEQVDEAIQLLTQKQADLKKLQIDSSDENKQNNQSDKENNDLSNKNQNINNQNDNTKNNEASKNPSIATFDASNKAAWLLLVLASLSIVGITVRKRLNYRNR